MCRRRSAPACLCGKWLRTRRLCNGMSKRSGLTVAILSPEVDVPHCDYAEEQEVGSHCVRCCTCQAPFYVCRYDVCSTLADSTIVPETSPETTPKCAPILSGHSDYRGNGSSHACGEDNPSIWIRIVQNIGSGMTTVLRYISSMGGKLHLSGATPS